jgi:glycosyltransferase involved in cell wall biosynthesis
MKNSKVINIGIDASFTLGEKSGTSVYTNRLIENLAKIDKHNKYTIFPFFTYIYNPRFKQYQPKISKNFILFWNNLPKWLIDILWKKLGSLGRMYLPRFDIFHSTTFSVPPPFMYKKLIVTVYDVSFYTHPQFHLKENIDHCTKGTREAVKKADVIIAISNNTKRDLISYFDCPQDKIVVTYLACEERFFKKTDHITKKQVLKKYKIDKPFIFHLGSLEPRKNTLGLVKAYLLLPKKIRNQFYLVIAGAAGWLNDEIFKFVNKNDSDNSVKLIGYVRDRDLPVLYQSARCFAYPSFYEGFGIPPLEAMASGCPILTSKVSSLPEICGDAAVYCVPNDIEDIGRKLHTLLEDDHRVLVRKGLNRAKKFSWDKTTKQTLGIYKNLC